MSRSARSAAHFEALWGVVGEAGWKNWNLEEGSTVPLSSVSSPILSNRDFLIATYVAVETLIKRLEDFPLMFSKAISLHICLAEGLDSPKKQQNSFCAFTTHYLISRYLKKYILTSIGWYDA